MSSKTVEDLSSLLSFRDRLIVRPHCGHKTFSILAKAQEVRNFKLQVLVKLLRSPRDCEDFSTPPKMTMMGELSDDENKALLCALHRKRVQIQNTVDRLKAGNDKRTEKEKQR